MATEYSKGLRLIDDSGIRYVVIAVTERIVLVQREVSGILEPATTRAFCDLKYRVNPDHEQRKNWNYADLAATRPDTYSAEVRPHAHGGFIFIAYPHRGDHCSEFIGKTYEEVLAVAEAWVRGEQPVGIYSASF